MLQMTLEDREQPRATGDIVKSFTEIPASLSLQTSLQDACPR